MKKKIKIGLVVILALLIPISLNINIFFEVPFFNFKILSKNNANLSIKTARLISNNEYSDNDPAIAIDSGDVIHIVYSAYDDINLKYNIIYVNSTNYTALKRISSTGTDDSDPEIDIDTSDIIHIVWEGSENIYYTNSTTNFTNYTLVSSQTFVNRPQIACDSSGIAHVTWMGLQSSNYDIYYANSSDSFSNNIKLSQNSYDDEDPDICVNNGIVHIVWEKEHDDYGYDSTIVYSNSTGNFASEKTISKGGDSFYTPSLDIDNSGNIHVVWFGYGVGVLEPEQILLLLFINFYLPYYNDVPFVPRGYRHTYYPYYYPTSYYYFDYHIYYSNSINNFQTQLDISKSVSDDGYDPDIVIDSDNVSHIVWYGDSYYSYDDHIFYTNSSSNFEIFNSWAVSWENEYPKIANDSANQIHCVFTSYNYPYSNEIYYINSTDFTNYARRYQSMISLLNMYTAIPKLPENTELIFIVLATLVGFNLGAITLYFYKSEEPKKPDEKEKDNFKRKKRGKKVTVERKGKKVKVKLP